MKHEKDALRNVDLVLTWGADSRELWERSGMAEGVPVHASGNPRIDMLLRQLRPYHQSAIDSIRKRFGDFVLFNSNFGTVNNRVTGAERFNLAKWVDEKEVEAQAAGFLGHKRATYEHFRLLMPKLADAIAPRILVIRPHPAEDHAPWNEIAVSHDNVRVVFEGSVVPWIAAAKVLIHNGCTSAVEAAIAGTPVISYRPVTNDKFDNALPNSAGTECFSEGEAIGNIRKVLERGAQPLTARQTEMLHHFIAFEDGKLSSDVICDALEQHAIGRMADRKIGFGTWLRVYLKHRGKRLSRYIKALKARDVKREDYRKLKFSGLDADIANERIAVLRRTLSRFGDIRAHAVAKDILELR
jgi:surface carbohydrate biosynthesis protein